MGMRTLVVLALVAGCSGSPAARTTAGSAAPATRTKSLYDRLGGMDGITAVVEEAVAIIVADPRINTLFANADKAKLEAKLGEQICQATGGPCTYTGKGMKEAHAGMNIKKADFEAFVDDLVQAMRKFEVPAREQQQLLELLAPMERDIVAEPQ